MKERLKSIKGITLIALIITIIVMLILVLIVITVALNGGLFTKAQQAVNNMTEERDRELSISAGNIQVEYVSSNEQIDFDSL